ncbi:histone deacetylase family protein [Variovorax sp. J22P168]|uniref:histone deacetylase family protein n=1 Tax=Variovorax jilinensis TaxID=3053513 RepID=UPI00257510D4|nr:histone deacetylase family protein [Variovorax sp. J22P168]MDM0012296.1 histone deacetylase family protein [Variovorax sp. J22P168]
MLTIHNDQHALHHGKVEMFRGELVPCFEVPARVDHVLHELQRRRLGRIETTPDAFDDATLAHVHAPRYLDFLASAWDEWVALDPANTTRDALPSYWPIRTFRADVLPASFPARMGLFSYDAGTPLTAGTWTAARAGAGCALTAAARVLGGERAAFALTRPPGHHAGADFFGGYCFLNNAAIAAQALRDAGIERVAVLDIDYHHGNGTQAIFYDRADVHFTSVHGDPHTEYPYYLGYADERGEGAGFGFNHNLPLPKGTGFAAWREALHLALRGIAGFRPGALVVSLGLDTFAGDPVAGFALATDDYLRIGEDLASAGLPTVFVFEGGYAVAEVGVNAVNVLDGFMQHAG